MRIFNLASADISFSKIKYFLKIFIPVLATLSIIIIIVLFNFHQSKNISKRNALKSMETFSIYCESTINNIVSNCNLLETNPDILYLLDYSNNFKNYNYINACDYLNTFVESNHMIYSTAIINRAQNEVLSPDGLYSLTDYFNKEFILNGYKDTYWSNFRIYNALPYKILPPVISDYRNIKTPVIPIIFRELSNLHNNYLLITISLSSLTQNSPPFISFTPNSELYILNNYTGDAFNITNNFEISSINGTDIYDKMLKGITMFDIENSNNEKSVLFSFSPTNKILGYTYYMIIPYNDINSSQLPNILTTSLLLIFTLAATLILTNKNANDYFTPIEEMENILGKNMSEIENKDKNHVNTIANAVSAVVKKYNKIENILPFAQEQYLISFLNDSTVTFDQKGINEDLLSTLPFSKKYFSVVIIQLSPTQKLFEMFSQYEYENIFSGFFNIIRNIYAKAFNAFFLSVERESTYVIINTDEQFIDKKLSEIADSVKDMLKYDQEFVELYIVNGNLHENMEGLKQSYTEALKKLSGIPLVRPKTISAISKTINTSLFSSDNELKLLNFLLTDNIDSATEMVQNVTNQCVYNDEALLQIYHRILAVIFNAMYIKNISIYEKDQSEFEFYFELFNKTPNMLYKKIMMLMSKFRTDKEKTEDEISDDISKIIIEKYSDSSLSLDTIADLLNINKRILSQQIKKIYGISFHSYLENIRIEKAKSLLTKTNKTIQTIYEEIGFTNKQTFIRSFKKITGHTPSSYRQNSD